MINVPAGARVLLAPRPIDFRKGAHSLAALAQEVLAEDPFSGAVIVYRAKRSDRLKMLVWDTSGLVLVWKQLQQGGNVTDPAFRFDRRACFPVPTWQRQSHGAQRRRWEEQSHPQPRTERLGARAWRGWRAPDLLRSEHRGTLITCRKSASPDIYAASTAASSIGGIITQFKRQLR